MMTLIKIKIILFKLSNNIHFLNVKTKLLSVTTNGPSVEGTNDAKKPDI